MATDPKPAAKPPAEPPKPPAEPAEPPKPPAEPPAEPPNPAAGRGAAPAKPPAAPVKKLTDYVVFEAVEVDGDGLPLTLKRVASGIEAENPKEARWAAAESDPALLARTKPDGKGDPPKLLPIAVRLAEPVPTREAQEIKLKRE